MIAPLDGLRRRFARKYGMTRIRMPGGVVFDVPIHYATMTRQLRKGLQGSYLIEIPAQGRRVVLNARQVCYIAEMDATERAPLDP